LKRQKKEMIRKRRQSQGEGKREKLIPPGKKKKGEKKKKGSEKRQPWSTSLKARRSREGRRNQALGKVQNAQGIPSPNRVVVEVRTQREEGGYYRKGGETILARKERQKTTFLDKGGNQMFHSMPREKP